MSRYASRLLDEGVGRRVGNSAGGNSKAMAANTARKPAGGAPEAHPTTDRYAERLAPPPLKDVRGQLGQRRTLPFDNVTWPATGWPLNFSTTVVRPLEVAST